jgi:hypothetical protein
MSAFGFMDGEEGAAVDKGAATPTLDPPGAVGVGTAGVLGAATHDLGGEQSFLDVSTLNVPSQRRASTSSPNAAQKKEITDTARNWVRTTLIFDPDPESYIVKGDIFSRYCLEVRAARVVDTTLGKYIKEIFPTTTTRRFGG